MGVLGLGFAEAEGDGLGRLVVGTSQIQGIMELRVNGQAGEHGHPMKTRVKVIFSRVLLAPDWQGGFKVFRRRLAGMLFPKVLATEMERATCLGVVLVWVLRGAL